MEEALDLSSDRLLNEWMNPDDGTFRVETCNSIVKTKDIVVFELHAVFGRPHSTHVGGFMCQRKTDRATT